MLSRLNLRFTLKLRLMIGFAAITVVFLSVAVINTQQVGRIKTSSETQRTKVGLQIQALELKGAAQDIKDIASGLMISRTTAFIDKYKEARPTFQEKVAKLGDTAVTEEQLKWRSQLIMASTDYLNMFDQAVTIITDPSLKDIDIQKNTEYLYQETQQQRDKIFTLVDQFYTDFTKQADEAVLSSHELMDQTQTMMNLSSIAVLVMAAAIASFIIFAFGRSIRKLQSAVSVISRGDLSHKINSPSKDELGELSRDFDIMVDKVRDMVSRIKTVATSLSEHSGQFQRFSKETASANSNILLAINEIADGADQQAHQSERSSSIMEELELEIGNIWSSAEAMRETSRASELNTQAGRETMTALKQASAETEQMLQRVQQAMSTLSSRSSQIGRIVGTISDISTQTNILSLNAAIEAARAGSYGKGFSVIAEEVRVLSQQTGESSRDIATIITGLTEEISRLEENLSASQTMLMNQNSKVEQSLHSFTAIYDSMVEVSTQANDVHEKVNVVRSKNNELIDSFQHVAAIAEETAAGVEEVSSTSTEQDASIRHIAAQADDINGLSRELFLQLESFIVHEE
jgi:methyl-accepting chemotaxis protein